MVDREQRRQLARDLRATAKHFGLSVAEEKDALDSARAAEHRAADVYRAIANSFQPRSSTTGA